MNKYVIALISPDDINKAKDSINNALKADGLPGVSYDSFRWKFILDKENYPTIYGQMPLYRLECVVTNDIENSNNNV